MKVEKYFKMLVCFVMLCLSTGIMAQSNGDKLFLEGQQLQKVQTVTSQNAAVKKFRAAKIVYTAVENKTMCDNQIVICNNNIRVLREKAAEKTRDKEVKDKAAEADSIQNVVVLKKRTDVTLSLSVSRLDFKYKPKDGAMQSVDVTCNYPDWEIASNPEWTTVYLASDKFSVEVDENTTEEERSGVIKVQCDDKVVDLVVNQEKKSTVNKLVGKMGGLFKKSKK